MNRAELAKELREQVAILKKRVTLELAEMRGLAMTRRQWYDLFSVLCSAATCLEDEDPSTHTSKGRATLASSLISTIKLERLFGATDGAEFVLYAWRGREQEDGIYEMTRLRSGKAASRACREALREMLSQKKGESDDGQGT